MSEFLPKIWQFIKENWFLLFAICYAISPIDLIPDFLAPVLGPLVVLDDMGLLIFELVRRLIGRKKKPVNDFERHVVDAEVVDDNKNKSNPTISNT